MLLLLLPILVFANAGAKLSAHSAVLHSKRSAGNHPLLEFHSGFWVNLHHFLYEEATVASLKNGKARDAEPELPADKSRFAALTGDEQKEWKAAISYYQTNLIDRDLVFEDRMAATKNRLEALASETTLRDSGLDASLVAALERAAPIYRAHWWPVHDQMNRYWISKISPLSANTAIDSQQALPRLTTRNGRLRLFALMWLHTPTGRVLILRSTQHALPFRAVMRETRVSADWKQCSTNLHTGWCRMCHGRFFRSAPREKSYFHDAICGMQFSF